MQSSNSYKDLYHCTDVLEKKEKKHESTSSPPHQLWIKKQTKVGSLVLVGNQSRNTTLEKAIENHSSILRRMSQCIFYRYYKNKRKLWRAMFACILKGHSIHRYSSLLVSLQHILQPFLGECWTLWYLNHHFSSSVLHVSIKHLNILILSYGKPTWLTE